MPGEPAAATALQRVLRWLALRDRSEREVRERLGRWAVPAAEAEAVLATLYARGYLNDAALAERVCDWHDRHDPLGPLGLRERLARRGIAAGAGEAAVAARAGEARQLELAAALLARREAALAGLPPARRCRRLHDLLARRGFSAAVRRRLCDPRRFPAGDVQALDEDAALAAGEPRDADWPEGCEDD
jgi:regulatory protein